MSSLVCPICPPERTSHLKFNLTKFMKHIKLFHSHQPGFSITCGLHGCLRTFRNFRTFQNHVSDYHAGCDNYVNVGYDGECQLEDHLTDDYDCGGDDDDGAGDSPTNQSESLTMQESTALFLMGLREKHKLTQVALQGVIEGVTSLMQCHVDSLHTEVCQQLQSTGTPQTVIDSLECLFSESGTVGRPFAGLETQHQQLKFYRDHFNLIEPVRVTLGEKHDWIGSGSRRHYGIVKDEMMYIPLLKTIECLLQRDSIVDEIRNGHKSNSNHIEDYCDGVAYSSHPLFSVHSDGLQIFFYFDDLEVCNPLGSKRKIHKISIFYFMLGNVSPKFRSKLSSIQLVAIALHRDLITYGMDTVLKPFIEDVMKLERGCDMTISGRIQKVYGTIAAVSADNLGSLALGGFKESCSAFRCCRQCMTTQETSKLKFTEDQFELRSKATHIRHCTAIESGEEDASRDYGVNRNSVLNNLRYFHVCEGGLLPDVMHDVLEGALQYEVKIMLQAMVEDERYFTLNELNSRLGTVELGYMEAKDRPSAIGDQKLSGTGHTLNQAAAQMWLLARILPLSIGDLVPEDDERWSNFLRMLDVVDILFCPRITEDDAAYLASLISDHHEEFCYLYPSWSVIPKMHFMVHMPRLMIQFGPLVRHWTMRFEAKHAYFKSLCQTMGNFINIPYSLAMRHQQYQCYLSTSNSELEQLSIGPGSVVVPAMLADELECEVATAYQAKWVTIDGVEFKQDAAIVHSVIDDLPQVAQIDTIYVINGSTLVFKAECYATTSYVRHLHAYTIASLHKYSFFYHDKLSLHLPVFIRTPRVSPHHKLVIMPFNISNF